LMTKLISFFCSSRRRHTRSKRDWSSDVCSSDLVDTAIFDGWRYLSLTSDLILSMTPREFSILMKAQVERKYDDYEEMATMAIFTRQAYHREGRLGASDIFKR